MSNELARASGFGISPNALADAARGREYARGQNMTHDIRAPLDSLKGQDPLTDWALGMRGRFLNPLQAAADYAQEFQNLDPIDQGMQMLGGGIAGTFIGKGAKTYSHAMQETAQKMEKSGHTPEKIWNDTGTFKGADGQWRQEIPDDKAKLLIDKLPTHLDVGSASSLVPQMLKTEAFQYGKMKNGRSAVATMPIASIEQHGKLFMNYPELMDIGIRRENSANLRGSYIPQDKTITVGGGLIGDNINAAQSTTLHELQHAIQEREGWAGGGSPEGMKDEALRMLRRDVASGEIGSTEQAMAMLPMAQANAYKRLAGEAEARLTQSRMNMTMPERAASYPPSMFDVPMDQQIVRFGDNGPAMQTGKHSPEQMSVWASERKARETAQAAQRQIDDDANKTLAQKAATGYSESGMGQVFNSEQLDAIKSYRLAGDRKGANAEGTSQAVKSIQAQLETLGVPIQHVSEKGGGISLYANINNSIVRISDHELPLTPSRMNDRQNGLSGKWDREFVPNDWATTSLDDYMSQILGRNGAKPLAQDSYSQMASDAEERIKQLRMRQQPNM